ncbi:uncharacterized protein F4812DRAFT_461948 [Daldinia caldariorum]|uniref:uncharacterized protein n=1 Tax=Daldinia caldariorum TaxID=326644 RepID=UPI002007619B|nr:uncharacterized protein F4812DRAFT_461948 [Daldinia caldariorum]KAI1465103.1 hypothetical protein F4812DRAFT_461948 [Daldinia caldariorum]
MYIPQTNSLHPDSPLASASRLEFDLKSVYEFIRHRNLPLPNSASSGAHRILTRTFGALPAAYEHASSLRKRSGASVNTTIGVVVGILLAVFLIGFFTFVYFYGKSARFSRKRRHRRKSSGSKNSKNSEGAAGGGEPPAAA